MTNRIAVGKSGINALTATDPNDFIYHSDYNTFKIIASGLFEPTILHDSSVANYTVAHGQDYAPFVIAFMREASINAVVLSGNQAVDTGGYLIFESVSADQTNIICRISNSDPVNDIVAHIRYFIVL